MDGSRVIEHKPKSHKTSPLLNIYIYCNRRAKKAESDTAMMEPTTGKATMAEEAPGDGAGDSMVADVAELTNTAETKRATKKLMFLISILSFYVCIVFFYYVQPNNQTADGYCLWYTEPQREFSSKSFFVESLRRSLKSEFILVEIQFFIPSRRKKIP